MAPVVEKILDGLLLGEGPHWDDKNQCLYFLDMTRSTIHKYVPSTKKHTQVTVGKCHLLYKECYKSNAYFKKLSIVLKFFYFFYLMFSMLVST